MGEVINVTFGRKPSDGGKARIRRRREALAISATKILAEITGISPVEMCLPCLDNLAMDHADPEISEDTAQ